MNANWQLSLVYIILWNINNIGQIKIKEILISSFISMQCKFHFFFFYSSFTFGFFAFQANLEDRFLMIRLQHTEKTSLPERDSYLGPPDDGRDPIPLQHHGGLVVEFKIHSTYTVHINKPVFSNFYFYLFIYCVYMCAVAYKHSASQQTGLLCLSVQSAVRQSPTVRTDNNKYY